MKTFFSRTSFPAAKHTGTKGIAKKNIGNTEFQNPKISNT